MAAPSPLAQQCSSLSQIDHFLRPLSATDTKACAVVESAFPEHERCSEEKFEYRLHQTPELCLGLFIREGDNERLVGHVIANRTLSKSITEGSMLMPENWQSISPDRAVSMDGQVIGNDPRGNIIAIHSVAMSPGLQGKGVGKAMVKAYVQYIRNSQPAAERIVLIAHDYLIKFYESAGFQNFGPSQCQFAGGGWFDVVHFLGRD